MIVWYLFSLGRRDLLNVSLEKLEVPGAQEPAEACGGVPGGAQSGEDVARLGEAEGGAGGLGARLSPPLVEDLKGALQRASACYIGLYRSDIGAFGSHFMLGDHLKVLV